MAKRGIILLLVLVLFASVASSETLCSYKGPDVSDDYMRLTDFTVTGTKPLRVGDKIHVEFKLQNYGQFDIQLGEKGIFTNSKDPEGDSRNFGSDFEKEVLKYGKTKDADSSKVLDKEGTWEIWPSYQIVTQNGEKLGPNKWHSCEIDVLEAVNDSDEDGIEDSRDNCPKAYNPKQEDFDNDGIGNLCDKCDDRDFDSDGIKNCEDKCPDEPETLNKYNDADGCPDILPVQNVTVHENKTEKENKTKEEAKPEIKAKPGVLENIFTKMGNFFGAIFRFFGGQKLMPMPQPDYYLIKFIGTSACGADGEISPDFDKSFNETTRFQITYSPNYTGQRISEITGIKNPLYEVKGILYKEGKMLVLNWTRNSTYENAFRKYRESLYIKSAAVRLGQEVNAKLDTLPPGRNLCMPTDELSYLSGIVSGSYPSEPSGYPRSAEDLLERVEMRYELINDTVYHFDGLKTLAEHARASSMCSEGMDELINAWLDRNPEKRVYLSELAHTLAGRDNQTKTIFPEGTRNRITRSLRQIDSSLSRIRWLLGTIFEPEDTGEIEHGELLGDEGGLFGDETGNYTSFIRQSIMVLPRE
jgi:hypothetical protein